MTTNSVGGSGLILSSALILAGLVFALSNTASAQKPYQRGVGFAMIGIAAGQSARLNALNMGSSSSGQNSSCSVTLQFLDDQNQLLKQTVVTLRTGNAAFLDLAREAVRTDNRRAAIRGVLLFGYSGGAPPGPAVQEQFDCNIVPSLEIYDSRTGRSSIVLTATKELPPATSPAQ